MSGDTDRLAQMKPQWYCIWCAATSLNPCHHSPIYRWRWDSGLLALADDGEPIRDKAARAALSALDGDT